MEVKKLGHLTIEEYVQIQQENGRKYEYHNGAIFAMAGGSYNHSTISGNIFFRVMSELLKKKPECKSHNSDLMLHILATNTILYPDGMIICPPVKRSTRYKEAVTNPSVIIEVLSPSTESYDRGDKFHFYRQIPTLQEYILVSQDKKQVEVFRNTGGNDWNIQRYDESNETFPIESVGIELVLEELYLNVDFSVEE